MSEYHADCTELIVAGWGETERRNIPDDWRARRGPDPVPGQPHMRDKGKAKAHKNYHERYLERRAAYLAATGKTEVLG